MVTAFGLLLASTVSRAQPSEFRCDLVPGDIQEKVLAQSEAGQPWTLSVAVQSHLGDDDEIYVDLIAPKFAISKTLHPGDPDLYVPFAPRERGPISLKISRRLLGQEKIAVQVRCLPFEPDSGRGIILEAEPNNTWREANKIELGRTVYASGDDAAYILPLDTPDENVSDQTLEHASHARTLTNLYKQENDFKEASHGLNLTTVVSNLDRSVDWYRLNFAGPEPRLVMFEIELLDRDNIPCDVSIYRQEADDIAPYDEGVDPVSPPHEVQALPGNKFTTRVLRPGAYYLRVVPNHPDYQLRTRSYPVPPYSDPRQAVRTAMDYIVGAGDSWHANTPRMGGLVERIGDVHQETENCIACHPTHFSMRAEMTAVRNGYPVIMRPQVQFLAERFYNNPRPFYGQPDTTWSRMISAAANVSSRPSSILFDYEDLVNGDERLPVHKCIANYLRLYYKDVTELKADESNGNKPLVSTYEVAFYTWDVFHRLFEKTHDESYRRDAEQIQKILEEDAHKNLVDLCYQTIALAKIDLVRYAEKLKANGEKILSYQRPTGFWSMLYEPDSQEVEFQTGHCLYALALAGFPANDPRIEKSINALLTRQQPFGGWFDPTQAYENFRTPFRETQFAIMALSEFFKNDAREKKGRIGWDNGTTPLAFSQNDPRLFIDELDRVWSKNQVPGGAGGMHKIRDAAQNPEAMVRLASVTCLGRIGSADDVPVISACLGDPSKMVQRAAAWSLRQLASSRGVGLEAISTALKNSDERVRWGAERIFYRHFAGLVQNSTLLDPLISNLDNADPTLRLQASKSLSRWWYWSPDRADQRRIESALVSHLGHESHAWPARGLREAVYNVLDENTRYLYNNWIPLMAKKEDQKATIDAHHAVVREQAQLVAATLDKGDTPQVKELFSALSEFHLREGSYLLRGRYNRIGNDTEWIEFFPDAAGLLYRSFLPYYGNSDPRVREAALRASHVMRGFKTNDLAMAYRNRLDDRDEGVRAAAHEFRDDFPLAITDANRADSLVLVKRLLDDPRSSVKSDGAELASKWAKQLPEAASAIESLLASSDESSRAAAIRTLPAFPALHEKPEAASALVAALDPAHPALFSAALSVSMNTPALAASPAIKSKLGEIFASSDSEIRRQVLDSLDRRWASDGRVSTLVVAALADPAEDVRRQAVQKAGTMEEFKKLKPVRAAMQSAKDDASPLVRSAAASLAQGTSTFASINPSQALDFEFFKTKVEPYLAKPSGDGQSCVQCHVTHTLFKLDRPDAQGIFTAEQSRRNFTNALKVVNLEYPESSLMLRKPMSTAGSEGVVGASQLSHGGGKRWEDEDSDAYRNILRWVRGARLRESAAAGN